MPELLAAEIGNSRLALGRLEGRKVIDAARLGASEIAPAIEQLAAWRSESADAPLLIASVDDEAAARLTAAARDQLRIDVYRVGEDLPVPIETALDPETIVGIDRLLAAAAAYAMWEEACVVIDAGTAVTVDFVDGTGVFHGGAIAPGAQMQLAALAGGTALLPEVELRTPDGEPFGRNTADAMLAGVVNGIRGLVRLQLELYAERYGAYPRVIATGGDASVIFDGDELIERYERDLTLAGIALAADRALGERANDES